MPDLASKIKSLEEIVPIVSRLKSKKKKIVLGHGGFDLLHYGHMYYLQQAKKLGDVLVVSVVTDKFIKKGPNRPVFNEKVRSKSLAFLECVDYIVPCENIGPWEIMRKIKPHFYVKGEDTLSQLEKSDSGLNKDKKLIESLGGKLCFTKSLPFHSTDILRNYFGSFSPEVNSFLASFKRKYTVPEVLSRLESLKDMKVLVIGETIIDEYRYVTPLGKPTKANIISAHYLNKEEFAGGVLACANHVAGLCGKVDVVTYLGEQDSKEKFVRAHLKPNVQPFFFLCPGQPTIIKRRFVDPAYYSKFFEEYVFDRNFLPAKVEQKIIDHLKKTIAGYNLVIVIDYGHGFLSADLIKLICQKAKFLAVNTQTNSGNAGFNYISKYPRVNYACLDEIEARLATQDSVSEIERVMLSLSQKVNAEKLVVTAGHRGSISYDNGRNSGGNNSRPRHNNGPAFKKIPALAYKVTDPIGAGDAFLAISAPCAAANFPIELVSFIGNVAGSIAVGIVGNKSAVERDELFRHISYLLE